MPAIYATTVYAKPGQEAEVSRLYQELGTKLKGAAGYRGRHVLRALPATAPAAAAGHSEAPSEPSGLHFISVEIWESSDARAAHRKTDEFLAWYKQFTPNLLPEHTHSFYEDIGGDH